MTVMSGLRAAFAVRGARDGDAHRRSEMILAASVMVLLFLITAALTVPITNETIVVWTVGVPVGFSACAATILLARRGRADAAAVVLMVYTFLALATILWREGPGSNRLTVMIVGIVFVGCVLRAGLSIAFGLALSGIILVSVAAEAAGVLRPIRVSVEPPFGPFLRHVFVIGLLVTVFRIGYDRLRGQVVDRERRAAAAVEAARTINESLVNIVDDRTAVLSATRDHLSRLARQLSDRLTGELMLMRKRLGAFLATEASLGPERLGDVQVATEAAERLAVMIERLHEHATLGTTALRPAGIDMDALVRDVIAEYSRAEGAALITWRVDALPSAWADPTLIRTVIENLVTNAVKFSRGRPAPRIRVGFDAANDRYFVEDNGVGFEPLQASKLFTPFRRLHRADEFEGHGLGLANARRIIERSGGDIRAEGQPGEGAVVSFHLPRAGEQTS